MIATGWSDQPAIPGARRAAPPGDRTARARRLPAPRPACRAAACSSSAPRPPACSSPTSCDAPDARCYLAVGSHTRMPRRYRGMDIFWWLEQIGALDRTIDQMRSTVEARREPSLQLVGRTTGGEVDLATLAANGVTLTGRLTSVDGTSASFADDLDTNTAQADQRLSRVLRPDRRPHRRPRAHRRSPSPRTPRCPTPSIDAPRSARPPRRRSVDGDLGDRPPAQLSVAASPGRSSPTASSSTTTASPRCRACTCSASVSNAPAAPTSSTAWAPTPWLSPGTCSRRQRSRLQTAA